MRIAAVLFLAAHGFAHLVGFAGAFRLKPDIYHTTLLAGRVDVGDAGMRVMGVLWVLAALLFAGAAASLAMRADWFRPLLLVAAMSIGLGSSIFHPDSSRVARTASGGRYGFAQSLFQVGGNTGSALGPLLAAFVVLPFGQTSIAWFSWARSSGNSSCSSALA